MENGTSDHSRCVRIVEAIRLGDPNGFAELYESFGYLKWSFAAKLGSLNAGDWYHDVVIAVIAAIRKGSLESAERLPGYVTATARNMLRDCMRAMAVRPSKPLLLARFEATDSSSVEDNLISAQTRVVARSVLREMSFRDREVLFRFYIDEQTPARICADLELTRNQFRNVKSRAKARFTELMRGRMDVARNATAVRGS
jgi:RNA polymerase sigma factor (sigma-70 family)